MKTRLANHTCRRAARASGRLSGYFIRYFPESQVRRQSSASASRIRPGAVTARGSKRTRSSALVLVAVTEITPPARPATRVFEPTRREIPRHRGVTGVQAPVRQAQDLDGRDDTQVPMQRDRLAVGPVRQFGLASPSPRRRRQRRAGSGSHQRRHPPAGSSMSQSLGQDRSTMNGSRQTAGRAVQKRRASASPPGPKTRSSVTASVPGPAFAEEAAAPAVKPASLQRRAEARHSRPCLRASP